MTEQRRAADVNESELDALRTMVELHESALDRIGASARIDAVVGQPVTSGDRTVIPLAETMYAGGYGGGIGGGESPTAAGEGTSSESGSAAGSRGYGGGYGGGATARARAVALVEITPSGTRVIPVFDWTALGIAVLATLGALFVAGRRIQRAGRGGFSLGM